MSLLKKISREDVFGDVSPVAAVAAEIDALLQVPPAQLIEKADDVLAQKLALDAGLDASRQRINDYIMQNGDFADKKSRDLKNYHATAMIGGLALFGLAVLAVSAGVVLPAIGFGALGIGLGGMLYGTGRQSGIVSRRKKEVAGLQSAEAVEYLNAQARLGQCLADMEAAATATPNLRQAFDAAKSRHAATVESRSPAFAFGAAGM